MKKKIIYKIKITLLVKLVGAKCALKCICHRIIERFGLEETVDII